MRVLPAASLVALVVSACASAGRPTIRALPTTLSTDAARLLAGCEVQASSWDFEAACDGLVVARHAQPRSLEPPWLGLAGDRGNNLGARTGWSDRVLLTDGGPIPLREARFVGVDGDADLGFLLGISRDVGTTRDDLWCSGERADGDDIVRCETILTALLQPPVGTGDEGGKSTAATTASTTTGPGPATASRGEPARLRGRALSLPTTCRVQNQDGEQGTYRCSDVALAWRVVDEMDAAASEAEALLASLASDEEPIPMPCRLGYEASVCRGTTKVVVGTAFVDGQAVIASCIAADEGNALASAPCKTLLNGSW